MSQSDSQQTVSGVSRPLSFSLPHLQIEHLWMLVPLSVVAWMGFMHPLRKLDFWWHLKAGEVIVTSGKIPHIDLFSFTQAGQPFVYQMWLGEGLYYLVYRAGGFPLLIFFNTLLLWLTFIPVYHLCLTANRRLRLAILSSLVAAFVLGVYSNMRPQIYSFALFAAFYWILWEYREGRQDDLWALPLLMVLWVNLHGAFVLGIGMLGVVLGAEVVRRGMRGPGSEVLEWRALGKLALILGLTVAATLANPETYRVYAYVRQVQANPSVQFFVTEWQVPDIKTLSGILTFFGPLFVVLVVLLYARRRLNLTELGLFFVFMVLGLTAARNGIWFVLIAAPMLARHVSELETQDLLDNLRSRLYLDWLARALEGRPRTRQSSHYYLNWVILILLLTFTLLLSPWIRPRLAVEELRPRLIEQGTPVGAMDYIAEHKLTGNIFHPQEYGDYLIWRLWPQQRSFIDGRVHLYDESLVRDYILTFHDGNWESRIAKYDIQYLLLPKDDKRTESMIEDARASRNWSLLYEDDISILFEKQFR